MEGKALGHDPIGGLQQVSQNRFEDGFSPQEEGAGRTLDLKLRDVGSRDYYQMVEDTYTALPRHSRCWWLPAADPIMPWVVHMISQQSIFESIGGKKAWKFKGGVGAWPDDHDRKAETQHFDHLARLNITT